MFPYVHTCKLKVLHTYAWLYACELKNLGTHLYSAMNVNWNFYL